ncbi:ATP-grasp domain-containing protein [Neobacillus niacini]|uniref:ATP-grasp domain-containing protein n=1 Tax=Neobacillus niacini TaxID=86668 RepID=UPI002FFF9762
MSGQLNGWLVYKKENADKNEGFIRMLTEEAAVIGITLALVFEEDLILGIKQNQPYLSHPKLDVANIRFAVVRTINPLLSKQFEYCGIRCFNSSFVSQVCNDKARTQQYVTHLGIKSLDTYFLSNENFNPKNLPSSFPMVLKQVDGHGGNEVYLVHSSAEIRSILLDFPNKRFILQEFSDNPGKDLRVFVIGTNIIGAVLRESTTSFKANYTLGGQISPYHLTDAEIAIVKKIISNLQADFIGIDFLLSKDNELVFNEIEDVVGCRSLYSTSDVNAARLYVEHINKAMKMG